MIRDELGSNQMDKHTKQMKLAETIENMCNRLLRKLKNTDYKAMDSFKPFIQPKENIGNLLGFYDCYTTTQKKLEKIRIKIEHSPLENEDAVISIKELDELKMIELLTDYKNALNNLKEYSDVNIVRIFVKESREYFDKVVNSIKLSFLNALTRLPKVIQNIHLYSQFLLKNINEKDLTREYTKQVHSKMGFFGIQNNFHALVSSTVNLTQYFNLIIKLNIEILGKRVAHNINIGLISLMIINLKRVICDHLMKIEKNPKGTDIPLLIKLSGNLKHSKGTVIKEIEDLFIFKDQINKVILNCLVQFLAELEFIEHPNSKLKTEDLNITMEEILTSFKENEKLKEDWVSKFGPSFGVYKSKDLAENFAGKCLIKTQSLSGQLSDIEKYVYLINNKCIFKNHIKKIDGMNLKLSVDKDCQLILGMWKINLETLKGLELNRYLENEFEIHTRYYLPDEQRKKVQDGLKEIVEDLIVRRIIQGQTLHFKEFIERTYIGE